MVTNHVVSFSGGVTSWAAGKLVKEKLVKPGDSFVLLFADTKMVSQDVYDFLYDGAENIGCEVTVLADGRDPWEIFRDERFLGRAGYDPCSKLLKRKLLDDWMTKNCSTLSTVYYVGLDFTEINRYETFKKKKNWICCAPLIDFGVGKSQAMEWAKQEGLKLPSAYAEGFQHANCQNMCVKTGKGNWAKLLEIHPDRYLYAEQKERELREAWGKDVTILKEQVNGQRRYISLEEFRKRIQSERLDFSGEEHGGCGCALD